MPGGRGPSIWDAKPNKTVKQGHTPDVACDHYHRFRDLPCCVVEPEHGKEHRQIYTPPRTRYDQDDVALMAKLGMKAPACA
eukprot:4797420-Amphidinium_carterae.1